MIYHETTPLHKGGFVLVGRVRMAAGAVSRLSTGRSLSPLVTITAPWGTSAPQGAVGWERKDGNGSDAAALPLLGSLLSANASPRVRCEFSYGERRG